MEDVRFSYCAIENGDRILLVNDRSFKVKKLDEALDLLQTIIDGPQRIKDR